MAAKKASLQELMGKHAGGKASASKGLSLGDLPMILGDALPELPKNSVGRFRLVRALQQRFGKNFRSLPGVENLVKEFDQDIKHHELMGKLSGIKPKRSK